MALLSPVEPSGHSRNKMGEIIRIMVRVKSGVQFNRIAAEGRRNQQVAFVSCCMEANGRSCTGQSHPDRIGQSTEAHRKIL